MCVWLGGKAKQRIGKILVDSSQPKEPFCSTA